MQMSLLGLYDYQLQEEMVLMKKQPIQGQIKYSYKNVCYSHAIFL